MTVNELRCLPISPYGRIHAPGLKLPQGQVNQSAIMACWRMAWGQAIRASARPGPRWALPTMPTSSSPSSRRPIISRRRKRPARRQCHFPDAIMEGAYPDSYLNAAGPTRPSCRRRHGGDRQSDRFRRAQHLYADLLKADPSAPRGTRRCRASALVTAYGIALAVCGTGGRLLGRAGDQRIVEAQGDLHQRKRLFGGRSRQRERAGRDSDRISTCAITWASSAAPPPKAIRSRAISSGA